MLVNVDRRTARECFLIPELCKLTGMSEELLDDFRATRDIKQITHSDAPVKVKECINLFESFKESKECKSLMEEMDIQFVQ